MSGDKEVNLSGDKEVNLFTDIFIEAPPPFKDKWYKGWYRGITSNYFFRVCLLGFIIGVVTVAGLYFFTDYEVKFLTVPSLILGNIVGTFIVFFVRKLFAWVS